MSLSVVDECDQRVSLDKILSDVTKLQRSHNKGLTNFLSGDFIVLIPGSHIPAGNFLHCLCILLTGGSATKVLQMFKHMHLGCVSLGTFFKYQEYVVL